MASGDRVKSGIINPNATNSLVLFLLGSIIAGFAAGLGWGLATKLLEKNMDAAGGYLARRRAMRAMAIRNVYR